MRNNKRLLTLSLLTCSLLASCGDDSLVIDNAKDSIGYLVDANGNKIAGTDTVLQRQSYFDSLYESQGPATAVQMMIKTLASTEFEANKTGYHTEARLYEAVSEKFMAFVDGHSYDDKNGNFDEDKFAEYVEDTLGYKVGDAFDANSLTNKLSDEVKGYITKNYDKYIEKSLLPEIYENYLYINYYADNKTSLTTKSATKLEVFKFTPVTDEYNNDFYEAFISDLKKLTSKSAVEFALNGKGFATSDALGNEIVLETTSSALTLKKTGSADRVLETTHTSVDAELYQFMEDVLIARAYYNIDREATLARNYLAKDSTYKALSETKKSEAESLYSTYTSTFTKSIADVVKEKKISASHVNYYYEPEYYTSSTFTNVLPSGLSSLRSSTLSTFAANLKDCNGNNVDLSAQKDSYDDFFLVSNTKTVNNPVYYDTDSSTYYVCEVSEWYGVYLTNSFVNSEVTPKSDSSYTYNAYRNKSYTLYEKGTSSYSTSDTTYKYDTNPEKFDSIIKLTEITIEAALTETYKKDALKAAFEKYGLEINDQDLADYLSTNYSYEIED